MRIWQQAVTSKVCAPKADWTELEWTELSILIHRMWLLLASKILPVQQVQNQWIDNNTKKD